MSQLSVPRTRSALLSLATLFSLVALLACAAVPTPAPAAFVLQGTVPQASQKADSLPPATARRDAAVREMKRWSEERARRWYEARGWLVGVNYIPSTAVNQLEMWQADTFDPATIERELGWAESLGFNSLRVFLHDLAWKNDPAGLYGRVDQFLGIAHRHRMGVMLVIFDGVWNPLPRAGKQAAPRPYVHNSGWVQSPGAEILGDPSRHEELEPYVKGIVARFKNDPRVDAWDVFNEPDNDNGDSYAALEVKNKSALAALLIEKTFRWAREAGASQPLTAAPWLNDFSDDQKLSPSDAAMLRGSDIISFHNYSNLDDMRLRVTNLRRYGRPIICSEYMARSVGSTFNPILGYLKSQGGGAYSWGFVSGKSQTIYPWSSWKEAEPSSREPETWFHDLLRPSGEPYDPREVAYIRSLTGAGPRGVKPIQLKGTLPPG